MHGCKVEAVLTWARGAEQVMKCAQDFMPAMETDNLLKASENKLLQAAKTPQVPSHSNKPSSS